jgi:hypothetical protein
VFRTVIDTRLHKTIAVPSFWYQRVELTVLSAGKIDDIVFIIQRGNDEDTVASDPEIRETTMLWPSDEYWALVSSR